MNLARLGEESLQTWGEYVSLAFEGREWTNVEQQRAANRFAHALGRLGVGPGDRVVVTAPELLDKLGGWPGAVVLVGGGAGGQAWDALLAGEPDAFVTVARADD